jgi:hypothetical protein
MHIDRGFCVSYLPSSVLCEARAYVRREPDRNDSR